MTYQVYAIRTRPQSFDDVIGQGPVISALSHALDKNMLHHAYLFTGTRGVGKTTIARIIAKALNCEEGVSSKPCNKCHNCQSISQGKFADLIEIDAASKTKVEDTRALLDTVIYSPTQGRYKIYLIDEVHMLSTHSFNALLKTLEEPPSHVKFLLATTDPQKIPATIVSRCLQFTLKWVDLNVIANHIENILTRDKINFEKPAIDLISQAAHGSVRDSLSLLEQAVAIGAGEVKTEQVRTMLGRVAGSDIVNILNLIVNQDSKGLIKSLQQLAVVGTDFEQLLTQLIYNLHYIAILQQAPDLELDYEIEAKAELKDLSSKITPEDLQVYYQIALLAKRDLPYSPQPRLALEMALIRMLDFVPVKDKSVNYQSTPVSRSVVSPNATAPSSSHSTSVTPSVAKSVAKLEEETKKQLKTQEVGNQINLDKSNWSNFVNQLNLIGILLQILKNSEFISFSNQKLTIRIDNRLSALVSPQRLQDIEKSIQDKYNSDIKLIVEKNNNNQQDIKTPAGLEKKQKQEKHANLVAKLQNDPNINKIIKTFDGELKIDSVELTED